MNMQEVLTYHPLGPLPWYIATADGTPTKTAKAAQLHILEGKAQHVEVFPDPLYGCWTAWLLHSTTDIPTTFSSLACYVFHLVTPVASQDSTRTDMTMDQNHDVSIKNPERENGVVQAVAFK